MSDNDTAETVTVEGEPSCYHCGSGRLEPMFSDIGQYKGSWCENCGCINTVNGLSKKPHMVKDTNN